MPVTFTRFAETIHCKEDKRVVSVTVKLRLLFLQPLEITPMVQRINFLLRLFAS